VDTGKKGGSGARAKSTTDSRWRFYAGIVAVVAAAGAVGGAWFVKRKAADSVEATSSTDGPAPSSRHVERGLSALRQAQANAVPAERYELSYTFTSSQQAKPFMDFSVQGSLDLADATVAASALPELRGAANGETMLQGRFRGRVGLSQLGTRDSSDTLSRLQSDFEKPFYAKFAKSGQLVRMYFSPGVERLVQTSWRAFMSAAQHVVPQGDSRAAGTWQVEESDSAGRYLAEYSQEYVGSLLQVNKTKLQYRALSSGVNHRIERFSQAAGFVASEMPPAGRSLDMTSLRSLEYSEKSVASAIGAVSIDITGETRVSLAHARTDTSFDVLRVPETQSEQLKAAEMLELTDAGSAAAQERELDHAIASGATFESTLIVLRHPAKTEDDRKRRAHAYRQFASLLRIHPEKAKSLAEWIKGGDEQSNTFISALRDAGTKEAQAALLDVYRDPGLPEPAKMSALRAVSLLNKPTTESTALLRELSTAEGLTGEQAVYGLGTHASRAAANGQDAAPIVGELVDGLGGAKTPQEEAKYLAALGNAGSRDAVEEITTRTKSESEAVRREAVHALRSVPGADVDATLARALLQGDPDMVRAKAANAIRDRARSEVLSKALAESLRTERSRPVKTTVIQVASLWVSDSPEIQASLEWLVANESDDMLRKAALAALGSR
jgi:HEAT repeat protein